MDLKMKFPLVVISFMFIIYSSFSVAGSTLHGWGVVNMQGAIIDTACAIDIDSRDQTIDMEVIPIADIIRDGQGRGKSFSIDLVNCDLQKQKHGATEWKHFQITFDGDAEGDLFGVQGEASGVALRIIDDIGNTATPGKPLPLKDIIPSDMQLNYTLKLVANNHVLKSGDYFSVIRFKLDYF
jgi:type 1 fimbria pilin